MSDPTSAEARSLRASLAANARWAKARRATVIPEHERRALNEKAEADARARLAELAGGAS